MPGTPRAGDWCNTQALIIKRNRKKEKIGRGTCIGANPIPLFIIYATPSRALVHGAFRVATAGGPPSETDGGSAANTPGGTTAQPAAGGRRGTPRAYSPIVNNVLR